MATPSYAVRKQLSDATLNEGLKAVKAGRIARQITANCDGYHAGQIDHATWDSEQKRLWKLAADDCIMRDVMRILFPK